jgi:hypothetical protein
VEQEFVYRFRQSRFWLFIILWWFYCMIGHFGFFASRFGVFQGMFSTLWISFHMLLIISVCMVYERGQWNIWKRIGFVILSVFIQVYFNYLFLSQLFDIFWKILENIMLGGLILLIVLFIETLPLVVYAMSRSELFVERKGIIGSVEYNK